MKATVFEIGNEFYLLKNGKNAETVWAKKETKEIVIANKNSFGYNMKHSFESDFYKKYGCNLKRNQGKSDYTSFYYSAKSMESIGFVLVKRGESTLW
jgi:hypothetical protein